MAKVATRNVEHCGECPWLSILPWGPPAECKASDRSIDGSSLMEDVIPIPSWCPLPDADEPEATR